MSSGTIPRLLARHRFLLFNINYSPQHQTFITQHVIVDKNHPLFISRKRAAEERPRTGLWWHATVTPKVSPRSVIRSWLRRRLTNAFVEELKARGIDKDGKIKEWKHGTASKHAPGIRQALSEGKDISLVGAVKLNATPQLLLAKYDDVKREARTVINILLQGLETGLTGKEAESLRKKGTSIPQHGGKTPAARFPNKIPIRRVT